MDHQAKADRQARIATARQGLRGALVQWAKAEHHASDRHGITASHGSPVHTRGKRIMTTENDALEAGFETEIRGRLVALEAILMSYLAHTALHVGASGGNMAGFVANAMGDAEDGVIHAAQSQDQAIAETALREMRRISGYMVAHITRHAAPMGSG